ncbi:MAG: hypothetical protein JOZ78_06215 [Chroococcidiopsidaceae cyanobacterium CP_BM_ER_R8_30]|nr:hypothetical protein [Chroococcidiopsidaceae cyanobacterium CP_BM_ER_R8_30]
MATQSDRQKRIMEHLSRSTAGFPKPLLVSEQRQQQVLDHVRLSTGERRNIERQSGSATSFPSTAGLPSSPLTSEQRKQQILEHIRLTRG